MIYKILILAATFMATASHQCDCSGKFSSSNNSPTSSMSDPSSSSSSSSAAGSTSSGGYRSCGCDYSSRGGGRGSDCDDSDGCHGAWGGPRCGGWGLPWLVVASGSPGSFHGLHHAGRGHPGGLRGGQLLCCHPGQFGSSLVGWGQPAWGGAM